MIGWKQERALLEKFYEFVFCCCFWNKKKNCKEEKGERKKIVITRDLEQNDFSVPTEPK